MGEVDILNCLLPGPENRFSNVAFDVAPCMVEQSPSVRSMGVMGQTTGQRCTCAILDDIEVLSMCITQLKQERVAHAVTEMESILKPDEGQLLPRKILYLGTPHTETSIYSACPRAWLSKSILACTCIQRIWIAMTATLIHKFRKTVLRTALVNEPTDPERFSHEDILQRSGFDD